MRGAGAHWVSAWGTETESRGSACADAGRVSQHAEERSVGASVAPPPCPAKEASGGEGVPQVQQHRSLAWGAPGSLQAGYLLRAAGPAVSGWEGLLESRAFLEFPGALVLLFKARVPPKKGNIARSLLCQWKIKQILGFLARLKALLSAWLVCLLQLIT